jgi:hypothetical protein
MYQIIHVFGRDGILAKKYSPCHIYCYINNLGL